jgi:cytochrome c oxidase subunit 2
MAMSRNTVALMLGAILAIALPAGASAQDLERGEQLFGLCLQCHGEEGEGNPLALAPAIAGLGAWYVEATLAKFKSGARGLHQDDLGGLRMYPMVRAINEEDFASIAAYVESLPRKQPVQTLEGGDPTKGAALYRTCAACHGAKAEGNQPLGPSLAYTNDWYLLTQLEKYKQGIRPSDRSKDPVGAAMIGLVAIFRDEQSMKDVIAYIHSLAE